MFSSLSKTKITIFKCLFLSSANALNLDQSKILSFGNELHVRRSIYSFSNACRMDKCRNLQNTVNSNDTSIRVLVFPTRVGHTYVIMGKVYVNCCVKVTVLRNHRIFVSTIKIPCMGLLLASEFNSVLLKPAAAFGCFFFKPLIGIYIHVLK